MLILDPYDMTFDAVGVFGLDFWLLFKSASSYCGSAKFPGYKESQFIKQQILRLFGSLPFGQLRVLVVAKGQKISEDLFKLAVR